LGPGQSQQSGSRLTRQGRPAPKAGFWREDVDVQPRRTPRRRFEHSRTTRHHPGSNRQAASDQLSYCGRPAQNTSTTRKATKPSMDNSKAHDEDGLPGLVTATGQLVQLGQHRSAAAAPGRLLQSGEGMARSWWPGRGRRGPPADVAWFIAAHQPPARLNVAHRGRKRGTAGHRLFCCATYSRLDGPRPGLRKTRVSLALHV